VSSAVVLVEAATLLSFELKVGPIKLFFLSGCDGTMSSCGTATYFSACIFCMGEWFTNLQQCHIITFVCKVLDFLYAILANWHDIHTFLVMHAF